MRRIDMMYQTMLAEIGQRALDDRPDIVSRHRRQGSRKAVLQSRGWISPPHALRYRIRRSGSPPDRKICIRPVGP